MRTTIELSNDHRSALHSLASQKGSGIFKTDPGSGQFISEGDLKKKEERESPLKDERNLARRRSPSNKKEVSGDQTKLKIT